MVIGTLAVDGRAVTFGTARGAWAHSFIRRGTIHCVPKSPPFLFFGIT